jgi:hypothetical protein
VSTSGQPHPPWTKRCGKCKGKGAVSRSLLPGRRVCPRCEGDGITLTLLGELVGIRATRKARRGWPRPAPHEAARTLRAASCHAEILAA